MTWGTIISMPPTVALPGVASVMTLLIKALVAVSIRLSVNGVAEPSLTATKIELPSGVIC